MRTSMIVGMVAAVVNSEMCCVTCTEPQEKYLSVDTKHNMCGECCMEPKDYDKFHLFEKNLEKANTSTPCADRGYHGYAKTVTHGALKIKMTLDLYNPDNATTILRNNYAADAYTCPGSAAPAVHASVKQTAVVAASCSILSKEIQARVAGQWATWHDPHNNGTYTLLSATATTLQLDRKPADPKYPTPDKLTITLEDKGDSCVLSGCSESQINSFIDYSTNYCNLRALYCGKADGCVPAQTDLTSTISETLPSAGAGTDFSACLTV